MTRPTADAPNELPAEEVPREDRRLFANVRPANWENPAPADRYDLVVVGAGTGGLVSAAIAAALGARVALVERDRMGGDCLNFGCVPSKGLIRAARSWAEARASAARFGGPPVADDGDFRSAMDRMRRIRADISEVDAVHRFRSLGVDVFLGEGRFAGPDSLDVEGARLRFRRAIVATGARAAVPSIAGLREVEYHTNETIFGLATLPSRLLVLGAGPIGCELAQAFARFGSAVTLVDVEDRILPLEESDAAAVVQEAMERDGVAFVGGARVTGVQRRDGQLVVSCDAGKATPELECDALLLALGRSPNVDLGLDAADVDFDPQAGVRTDDRLRTTNRRIYAVGDATSSLRFTHAADAQARLAVRNALFYGRARASDLIIPWATYTDPELARVGLSYREAKDRGVDIESFTIPMDDVDRARLDGDTDGFLRVHVRSGGDEIVGATIVAPHAGDLIAQVVQAMKMDTGLEALSGVVFPYPTLAEALRKAADARRRARLTDRAGRALRWFFRAWRLLP